MKKKNKKFNTGTIVMLLFGALCGAAMGFISSMDFALSSQSTPDYINIIIFLLTYIGAVAVHELGHGIGFTLNGLKMRALFITMFLFIKENKKWKFKIRPNNVTTIGGIAIPDLDVVKDENEFNRLQKSYANAIISGPITSTILLIGGLAISTSFIFLSSDIYLQSIFFSFAKYLTIISLFLLGTCFFKSEIAIGDFPAYKLCKKDGFFVAIQLYQYALFSSDPNKIRSENKYLKEVILNGLSQKLQDKDTSIFTLNILDTLIIEYLSGVSKDLPKVVEDYIDFLIDNKEWMSRLKNYEVSQTLRFHIIRLLYINEKNREESTKLYEELKNDVNMKKTFIKYFIKQTDHLFGYADNSNYLKDKNNIVISSAHGLWKNFDGYFIDETKLNEL